jgi:cytochrome b
MVTLVAFSWWSAENHEMERHYASGLTLLGLVVFRLIWGIIGGSTARFSSFVRSPAQLISYLRTPGGMPAKAGHNPLGGYSVLVLLALLSVQVGSGLFAVDVDGLESGPLSFLISFDQGRIAAELHEISFNLLLVMIALHVLAILFYLVARGRNLIGPMITGRDRMLEDAEPALVPANLWRFMVGALLAGGLAWWINQGLGL